MLTTSAHSHHPERTDRILQGIDLYHRISARRDTRNKPYLLRDYSRFKFNAIFGYASRNKKSQALFMRLTFT
jgi:hypothetical protein